MNICAVEFVRDGVQGGDKPKRVEDVDSSPKASAVARPSRDVKLYSSEALRRIGMNGKRIERE